MEGLATQGLVTQREYLALLGINARAQALARTAPERQEEIEAAHNRLVGPKEMGNLFKVIAVRHPDWPALGGFA